MGVPPPPRNPAPVQRSSIESVFFFLLLAGITYAFLGLISDFLGPVFWAAVLGVVFYPLHNNILRNMRRRPGLAALLSVLAILLLVILPFILLGVAVTREAQSLYQRFVAGELDGNRLLESLGPMVLEYLDRWGIDFAAVRQAVTQAATSASQWIGAKALELGRNALELAALFALMLYLLFFFLRDGERILEALVRALPLGDVRERHLFAKFAEVTRATLKGTLVVALAQGVLGGFLFWLVGIEAAVLWGVVMAIASLLPAIGAGLVWAPAGIILIVTGSIFRGIVVLAVGAAAVSTVDNVLRPVLVGRDIRMPDYLVLLSTLGGIAMFGLSGFVVGPVLAALFLSVWKMFEVDYGMPMEEKLRGTGAPETPNGSAAQDGVRASRR